MRALNCLTQNLIESLTRLLEQPGDEALQTLEVCAPVLIEQLQQIMLRAVDRRVIQNQLSKVLAEWLRQHPQPDVAQQALLQALQQQALLVPQANKAMSAS